MVGFVFDGKLVTPEEAKPSLDQLVRKLTPPYLLNHQAEDPVKSCEILTVVSSVNEYQWRSQKGNFFAERVRDVTGREVEWVTQNGNPAHLAKAIESSGCVLVIIHAFLFPASALVEICERFPEIRIVVINHSSLPYSSLSGPHHYQHILASNECPNLIYALTDDRIPLEHERMIWLPNPVRDDPVFHEEKAMFSQSPRIHVCGRADTIKGHFVAATTIALLAKRWEISAVLNIRNQRDFGMLEYLESHGVSVQVVDWVPWGDYPRFIADNVDLLIHPTLTESHNLVGIEHLLCGVPVVGSPAMRYLPKGWRRDPEKPGDIAESADYILASLREHSPDARRYGEKEATRCNEAFSNALNQLLT
jgi:hypothetical protein